MNGVTENKKNLLTQRKHFTNTYMIQQELV
jgi:hypothetical protein